MIGDRSAWHSETQQNVHLESFDFGLSSLGHRKRDLWKPCASKSSNPKGVDDGFPSFEHLSVAVPRCDSVLFIKFRYEVRNARREKRLSL